VSSDRCAGFIVTQDLTSWRTAVFIGDVIGPDPACTRLVATMANDIMSKMATGYS
jgi:hypothetical protein